MARATKTQIITELQGELTRANHQLTAMRERGERMMIQARYEAAQTYPGNENHWRNSDLLSPDASNRWEVRQRLMSRARFEIIENNPYLNGICQTICNDFAGSGVRIRLKDKEIDPDFRQQVERRWLQWQTATAFRQVLWSMRMDKIVCGETFAAVVWNPKVEHPVKLQWVVIEPDCVTDPTSVRENQYQIPWSTEVDGIKLDRYGFPDAYYVYNYHPGSTFKPMLNQAMEEGRWIPYDQICHWFTKMRRWHRGIPEITPSIPLCAVARRYTFALVKCMELQACLAAVLESETPATCQGMETPEDNPNFQTMPISPSMLNILPWGFKMKTFERVPVGQQYDDFIGSILREITRPLLVPYNMQIGSSKDSNMASGVLDAGIYTNGQKTQRYSCEEEVLRKVVRAWWRAGCITDGYFSKRGTVPVSMRETPEFDVIWDKVTIEHTDPTKIMNAMKIAKESGLMCDRDIQELGFNKDLEEFREDCMEDARFQLKLAEIQKQINELTGPQTAPQNTQSESTTENQEDSQNKEEE